MKVMAMMKGSTMMRTTLESTTRAVRTTTRTDMVGMMRMVSITKGLMMKASTEKGTIMIGETMRQETMLPICLQ